MWPLYYDHFDWLDTTAEKYAFADAGEVLRHLVYSANSETPQVQKAHSPLTLTPTLALQP